MVAVNVLYFATGPGVTFDSHIGSFTIDCIMVADVFLGNVTESYVSNWHLLTQAMF